MRWRRQSRRAAVQALFWTGFVFSRRYLSDWFGCSGATRAWGGCFVWSVRRNTEPGNTQRRSFWWVSPAWCSQAGSN
ncbi:hypothetical protein EV644_10850 [Kribbella orskensis]|uniref:Secreted protein n=1 Tax=Kribbella orskensis TaxID=2512216 RepID=A0ABY2BHJ8_9ACTN|nr:hypothetical protein EV642_10850 [Kribbella sp. VKM Ac-2500]TCO20836.1 hypothetical protein EV644_10850 [Kribbella orskensis]